MLTSKVIRSRSAPDDLILEELLPVCKASGRSRGVTAEPLTGSWFFSYDFQGAAEVPLWKHKRAAFFHPEEIMISLPMKRRKGRLESQLLVTEPGRLHHQSPCCLGITPSLNLPPIQRYGTFKKLVFVAPIKQPHRNRVSQPPCSCWSTQAGAH